MNHLFLMFSRLDKKGKMKLWKKFKSDCERYPNHLVQVPFDIAIPAGARAPKEVWRSKGYLLQIYDVNDEWERISINRLAFDTSFTRWLDGISWERLQELKAECGRGDCEAVEIFPAERDIVNVANLRHIWVRKSGKSFIEEQGIGWKEDSLGDVKPAVLDLITTSLGVRNSAQSDAKQEQGCEAPVSCAG